MFDTLEELKRRLRLAEDSFLETKSVQFAGDKVRSPDADSLANELAAFANTRGGVVVMGVDDKSKAVTGIPADKWEKLDQFVVNISQTLIDPPLPVTTQWLEWEQADGTMATVLRVDVDRSLFVHKSSGGYFHRVGGSRRQMSTEYLVRLSQQRSQARLIRFDEQTVPRAKIEDMETPLWARFQTERSHDERLDFLVKLGLAARDDQGEWKPTVTGVLMASRDPRRWLPNAYIQAVAYRGNSSVPAAPDDIYQLDAKDITGPLDEQVVEACRFVARNMKVSATKELGRRDTPQYDMTAVFEALVNAVAHRDYAVHGSKIRLKLFSDRLELYSPGSIPNTMTVESLPYRQSARNENLTSLLSHCSIPGDTEWLRTDRKTFMDRRGEGVQIILDKSEALAGRRPEYRLFDDAELLLTIFAAKP